MLDTPGWWDLFKQRSTLGAGGKSGGGGGKPKVRIGRTGPRGRRFAVPTARMRRSVIIKSKFILNNKRAAKRLKVWINYQVKEKEHEKEKSERDEKEKGDLKGFLGNDPVNKEKSERDDSQNRDAGEKEDGGKPLRDKTFFTQDRDNISPEEAQKLIEDNFGKSVAYHQLILSPGENIVDAMDYARKQIETMEERLGHKVTCVMNVHRDTDNTHVNVTIAGKIPDFTLPEKVIEWKDRDYTSEQIDLDKVKDNDKIVHPSGRVHTKFESAEELREFDDWLKENYDRWIEYDEYRKLGHWILAKEEGGDGCFGNAPLKERVLDLGKVAEGDRLDKGNTTITKYDELKNLLDFAKRAAEEKELELDEAEREKLKGWIDAKKEHGENVFGEPPMKDRIELGAHEKFGKLTLDLSKIPEDERVYVEGKLFTKYSSIDALKDAKNSCFESDESRIPQNQYEKLKDWLLDKQEKGEDCYGQAPMRNMTPEEIKAREQENKEKAVDDLRGKTVDQIARELTGGKMVSPQVVAIDKVLARADKMAEREARQEVLKSNWNTQGDVYLDRKVLEGMRAEGNYYVHSRVSPERELDHAIDREYGTDKTKERDRGREIDEQTRLSDSDSGHDKGDERKGASDDSSGCSRGDRGSGDDENERRRRGDDDSGRGH